MNEWKRVRGSQARRPSELDTTTSGVYVYQRRNIERMTIEDDEGNQYEMWEYEERKLTKDEYAAMLAEDITATQLALTELYERTVS